MAGQEKSVWQNQFKLLYKGWKISLHKTGGKKEVGGWMNVRVVVCIAESNKNVDLQQRWILCL
jgi:hypothetical protein